MLFFGLVLVPGACFMYGAGELMTVGRVARLQQWHPNSLYYPLNEGFEYEYKLALLKTIRPDFVVTGSSLPIFIKADYFKAKFVNLGRAMIYLSGGERLARDLVSTHHPAVVMLVLNFAWFTDDYKDIDRTVHGWHPRWSMRQFVTPYMWLLQGRLTRAKFNEVSAHPGQLGFGFRAIEMRVGYDRFGTFHPEKHPSSDVGFKRTFERIYEGDGFFSHGDHLSEERWQELLRVIDVYSKTGSRVLVVLPPPPPPVWKAMMKSGHYHYVDELRERMKSLGNSAFDFFDPESIGTSECEYFDGIHGGAVTWARILKHIAERSDEDVARLIDKERIDQVIEQDGGRYTSDAETYAEISDPMQLGCPHNGTIVSAPPYQSHDMRRAESAH